MCSELVCSIPAHRDVSRHAGLALVCWLFLFLESILHVVLDDCTFSSVQFVWLDSKKSNFINYFQDFWNQSTLFKEIFTKNSKRPRFVVGSFPRPLPPNTSTLNPPLATKIYNIIGRSMEQLVLKFWKKMIFWRPPTVHERVDGRLIFGHVFQFFRNFVVISVLQSLTNCRPKLELSSVRKNRFSSPYHIDSILISHLLSYLVMPGINMPVCQVLYILVWSIIIYTGTVVPVALLVQ